MLSRIGGSKMKNKCAVILCGGKGSRLGSLAKKIPKTLVKIQKKEVLWYIIKYLKYSGFKPFNVCSLSACRILFAAISISSTSSSFLSSSVTKLAIYNN